MFKTDLIKPVLAGRTIRQQMEQNAAGAGDGLFARAVRAGAEAERAMSGYLGEHGVPEDGRLSVIALVAIEMGEREAQRPQGMRPR